MKAYERMLNYIVIKTPCDEECDATPSTQMQFDLGRLLVEELKALGVEDAVLNNKGFVFGKIPATKGLEDKKKVGFIAHMDTVPQFCQAEIKPVITENYNGEDLPLGTGERVLKVSDFPNLSSSKGQTLITSDGNTLLGVDDKAGIAEIMTMLEKIIEGNIPHGPLRIAFTPDEEKGTGADSFDVTGFDADYAYTLDGDTEGEVQYENFNACEATFEVRGVSVHPGSAKDIMVNAVLLATEINHMLPTLETPRYTSDYEGFYHLLSINGDENFAKSEYIIRDHDESSFNSRKETLRHIEKVMNEKWGEGTVKLTIKDEYKNMVSVISNYMELIDNAKLACKSAGIEPIVSPIRGGTDGSKLSFMGLPCPNLGTGGHGYHGPFEHITAESMDKTVDMITELVKCFAK